MNTVFKTIKDALDAEYVETPKNFNEFELYDLTKIKRTPTIQTEELNFYIPEKWEYEDII